MCRGCLHTFHLWRNLGELDEVCAFKIWSIVSETIALADSSVYSYHCVSASASLSSSVSAPEGRGKH